MGKLRQEHCDCRQNLNLQNFYAQIFAIVNVCINKNKLIEFRPLNLYTQIMLQSKLFSKTQRTSPKDETAINAKLLTRGGYVRKMSAGVYAYLPLGWRVLSKINKVIKEEMNAIGTEELLMPSLVGREYWEKSGRWNADVMYKLASREEENVMPAGGQAGRELDYGLGWTHEEAITHIAADFIHSYKDLPLGVYQIQTKFRNEPRAKNGLLRCREFLMKDLYSFHAAKEDLDDYYQKVIGAYQKILKRLSLDAKVTEASGGAFTKEYTHEFQVLSPAGEDTIFYCAKCDFSQNKEIVQFKAGDKCPKCGGPIQESPGIEVANVFKLGTRYSDAFDLKFTDKEGSQKPIIMGSYGIGPSRLMATLVEVSHDSNGIIWPSSVSPYQVHLLEISGGKDKTAVKKSAQKAHEWLESNGIEVLFDEREATAGEKFADADLLGIVWRAVVSEKTEGKIELKKRDAKKAELVNLSELPKRL